MTEFTRGAPRPPAQAHLNAFKESMRVIDKANSERRTPEEIRLLEALIRPISSRKLP